MTDIISGQPGGADPTPDNVIEEYEEGGADGELYLYRSILYPYKV